MRAAPDSKISEVKTMDEIIRAVSKDGFVKISVVTARDAVQRANAIHHCSPTAIAALGRSLCAASMLGDLLKEENGTVTLRINGGGGLGTIVAVSDCDGNVRGMVSNPAFDLPTRPDGKLDVGGAVGKDGMLTVSRDIGLREPYVGSTELVSGEIAEDLSAYLVESEQIPAACGLGVLVDTDHSVKAAGGFLVQLMPGAPEELITKLEDNIFMMDQLTTILDEDGADAILPQVMRDLEPETVLRHPMAYRCACSRARVEQALRQCGVQELKAALISAEVENPIDMERIKLALQGYNFGNGYISWAKTNYGGYSYANAVEFSTMQAQRLGWEKYGDTQYPAHVLRYYPYGRAFTSGSNQAIVEVALTQLGNEGGQPYWSWYGFDGRVEWCACFVSWCADQCGYIESGIIPKFAGCVDGSNWFKGNGQWQDRNYEPQAGDIIFFDWEGDGETDHVGIVEKCENGVVYTVEGNSGDACRQNQYTVGSSSIYGYGVPAY